MSTASIYCIRLTYARELNVNQVQEKLARSFKIANNGCWEWFRSINKDGYGHIGLWGRRKKDGRGGQYTAHRVMYELINGEIGSNKQIDHLCKNITCVNPKHLEAVDKYTNNIRGNSPSAIHARKTHCPKGHEYSGANTANWSNGEGKTKGRTCRECNKISCRNYYYRKKERLL